MFQSTVNPNMPLRDLFYVTSILQGFTKDGNLHAFALIKIPVLQLVVFYNGMEKQPEQKILKISDAYEKWLKETPFSQAVDDCIVHGGVVCMETENRNVNIIADTDGRKLVLINDIWFKAKVRDDWTAVEKYLKGYIGDFYEIEETSEKIYISADFPDEYASSESRIALKGAVAKTKANAAQAVPELIRIAANPKYEANRKEKSV